LSKHKIYHKSPSFITQNEISGI